MDLREELYMKFPAVLRKKLLDKEIEFPNGTLFEYEKISAYRCVMREHNDNSEITLQDFKSYFELKKKPKSPRGIPVDFTKRPDYYGVSVSTNIEELKQKMHFPRPSLKMAKGYVSSEGGPQWTNESHVCWWLYENADVSSFKLMEAKNNE